MRFLPLVVRAVAVSFLSVALFAPPALAQKAMEEGDGGWQDQATEYGLMVVDVLISRPWGAVRTVVGSVFFLGAAVPVLTLNTAPKLLRDTPDMIRGKKDFQPDLFFLDEAWQRSVTDPFEHVTTRPLGSYSL